MLNHMVRFAKFLTKFVSRPMFTMLVLNSKGPDHHLKVARNMIWKVSLGPSTFFHFVTLMYEL